MYVYNTININIDLIKSKFISFFPYFKDPEYHCLIYHNSKLGYIEDKNQNVIGGLLYREYNEFPNIWELGHIKVLEEHRNKHLATNLLKYILLDIKQNKGKKVIVHVSESNKVAQSFYEKNNFIKEATIKKMKLGKEDLHLYTLEV